MNILCYGDSNTYGYNPADGMRYAEDVRWPALLRTHLGPAHRVIEEGCNGRTCSCTPADEEWKDGRPYLPACLNSHKPLDVIVLMLGSNDLKRQFHASPESIAAGIHEMLQTIADFTMLKQGYRPRVLLVSPPQIGPGITSSPFSDNFEEDAVTRSQKLAGLYRTEAASFTRSGTLQCDFLDAAKVCQASRLDSLHLDPAAHTALAKAIANCIEKPIDTVKRFHV